MQDLMLTFIIIIVVQLRRTFDSKVFTSEVVVNQRRRLLLQS